MPVLSATLAYIEVCEPRHTRCRCRAITRFRVNLIDHMASQAVRTIVMSHRFRAMTRKCGHGVR